MSAPDTTTPLNATAAKMASTAPDITDAAYPPGVTTGNLNPATTKVKGNPKARKLPKQQPGPTPNGRNLCIHRWIKVFKDTTNGMNAKFKTYYASLSQAQHDAYEKEAKELVAQNTWSKDICNGTMY